MMASIRRPPTMPSTASVERLAEPEESLFADSLEPLLRVQRQASQLSNGSCVVRLSDDGRSQSPPAAAAEEAPLAALAPKLPTTVEQSERLLEQMRKCILVHHQLSCLLIRHSALRAGLYADETPGEPEPRDSEVENSISNLGGSTARLFSMTLHDDQDLEAMEETLQSRVEEMVQSVRSELQLAGYQFEGSDPSVDPLDAVQVALGLDEDRHSAERSPEHEDFSTSVGSAEVQLPSPTVADAEAGVRSALLKQAQAEVLSQENAQLQTRLKELTDERARAQRQLDGIWQASDAFHSQVATQQFGEVEVMTQRNRELEELLAQLDAGHLPEALREAFFAEAAAARAAEPALVQPQALAAAEAVGAEELDESQVLEADSSFIISHGDGSTRPMYLDDDAAAAAALAPELRPPIRGPSASASNGEHVWAQRLPVRVALPQSQPRGRSCFQSRADATPRRPPSGEEKLSLESPTRLRAEQPPMLLEQLETQLRTTQNEFWKMNQLGRTNP